MNNKCLIGRGATTAVSQLQRSQSLKYMKETVKLHMTIKNNNGDGQARYVKRYMTDRWFSRIVGSLGRSHVLRHPGSTCT